MIPFSALIFVRMAHKAQGNIYIYHFIIKDIIKDTDEQLDEKVHRARSGKFPSARASVPGVFYVLAMWMYS